MDRIEKLRQEKIDSRAINWLEIVSKSPLWEFLNHRFDIEPKDRKISMNSTRWNQSLVNMETRGKIERICQLYLLLFLLVNPVCNNEDATKSASHL